MEKEGYVTMWAGNFNSKEELLNYFAFSYSEDGDAFPSKFEEDFKIGYFDEDFKEVWYLERAQTRLPVLLAGCSYEEVVIPRFMQTQGDTLDSSVNSIILLYNFQYTERIKDYSKVVRFVGTVRYK
ncbi:MAG: immunity 22 family protein [Neobacillus sp.]